MEEEAVEAAASTTTTIATTGTAALLGIQPTATATRLAEGGEGRTVAATTDGAVRRSQASSRTGQWAARRPRSELEARWVASVPWAT